MRKILIGDVQDTFLMHGAEDAVEMVEPTDSMEIGAMLTNFDQLQHISEEDQVRVAAMVFGAFTAGVLTALRLQQEEDRA